MILQWTVRLRGPDMFVGEGCGPSGPRSKCASHQNVAPLCSLFRVTLMVTNTFTGVRTRLRSQSVSFWQPVTCIVPDGTNAYFGENNLNKELKIKKLSEKKHIVDGQHLCFISFSHKKKNISYICEKINYTPTSRW